jgi:hypothetical protein
LANERDQPFARGDFAPFSDDSKVNPVGREKSQKGCDQMPLSLVESKAPKQFVVNLKMKYLKSFWTWNLNAR